MIELRQISKSYGSRIVLNDVNFNAKKGDIISIMGKSGSGKTTMLNMLGFLDLPTSGEYYFEGKLVKSNYQRSLIRNEHMGFVFQSYNLIPKLTVKENVELPIFYSVKRKYMKDREKKVMGLLQRFGLEDIANSMVEYISGGEKQRVCLARSLVCDADLIISDEPTGNLDVKNKEIILNEFKRMNEEGKTIIIVTHDKVVEEIANKKYLIVSGELKENDEKTIIVQ